MSRESAALKFSFAEPPADGLSIKVVGVGGGGCNAVNRMIEAGLQGVDFLAANTDWQSLETSRADCRVRLGAQLTRGRGAGGDPEQGKLAALEETDRLIELLEGADLVFIAAGLGGGTGTGGAPVIGSLASQLGCLTVAVVTKPFRFEGSPRFAIAQRGFAELKPCVDAVVTVLNDKLLSVLSPGVSFVQALDFADDVLRQAVQGATDLVVVPGRMNLEFSDLKAVLAGMGTGFFGMGISSKAADAAQKAIHHPLLEEIDLRTARGILVNITGNSSLPLHEVKDACEAVFAGSKPDAQVRFGAVFDETLGSDVRVTVIATGVEERTGLKDDLEDPRIQRESEKQQAAEIPAEDPAQCWNTNRLPDDDRWDSPAYARLLFNDEDGE
ncbi:MAG: cell division protein FtsZ [Acidobacteriota bacterium]|nr:MAG: cell division protein FtsZ [Acidobacteriota bacterium]